MLITAMQLSEFNFAHGQPTCKALYTSGWEKYRATMASMPKQIAHSCMAISWGECAPIIAAVSSRVTTHNLAYRWKKICNIASLAICL
jgi:hypothetical protein